jgi:hypothetical protein
MRRAAEVVMNNPLKSILIAMFTLTAVAAATGCAVPQESDENTDDQEEALMIGGGSSSGGTSLWCACKLNCDNDYSGMPVLIKACKAQCDTDNKCRKGVIGGGGGVIMY